MTVLLSACGGTADAEQVRAQFEQLDGFCTHVVISANEGQSVTSYEMDYTYSREQNDTFVLTQPEALQGISGTIAGTESGNFTLQYQDVSLDDTMPIRAGLTPADALFCLLYDLRTAEPVQVWTERAEGQTLLAVRYEGEDGEGKYAKQAWLTRDASQLICAEIYAGDTLVLSLKLTEYQPIS